MRMIKAVVGGILAIIIAILGVFLYGSYTGQFSPMFVSAVATAGLVLVTAVSVSLTLILLNEERESRQQEVMPVFKLELRGFFLGQYGLVLKNIGNGPAQNVEVTIELDPTDETRTVTYPNVAPGDVIPVPQPFKETTLSPDDFDEFNQISVQGTCEDVTGTERLIKDVYHFAKHENEPEWGGHNKTEKAYLKDIADELDDIEGELNDIERKLR